MSEILNKNKFALGTFGMCLMSLAGCVALGPIERPLQVILALALLATGSIIVYIANFFDILKKQNDIIKYYMKEERWSRFDYIEGFVLILPIIISILLMIFCIHLSNDFGRDPSLYWLGGVLLMFACLFGSFWSRFRKLRKALVSSGAN